AKREANSGGHTVIASGNTPDVLTRLASGERIGTELQARLPLRSARERWLVDHLRVRGRVTLDNGAIQALTKGHKSLLAIGVVQVEGDIERGDVVACVDELGVEYGCGLINYSSTVRRDIIGQRSTNISEIVGKMPAVELMHRDNMVFERQDGSG